VAQFAFSGYVLRACQDVQRILCVIVSSSCVLQTGPHHTPPWRLAVLLRVPELSTWPGARSSAVSTAAWWSRDSTRTAACARCGASGCGAVRRRVPGRGRLGWCCRPSACPTSSFSADLVGWCAEAGLRGAIGATAATGSAHCRRCLLAELCRYVQCTAVHKRRWWRS
jgi:hypothetical protein